MTPRRLGAGRLVLAGWILSALPAGAQISPGPLSRPHAELEGSGQCGRCHEPGRGVAPTKCLACHRALGQRVGRGEGLHARTGYQDCKTCHVEHQGTGYELVWWGKAGRDAFNHKETGHPLEGRHARLDCRDCHQPRLNRQTDDLTAQGVDLTRTFLGLGTSCRDCHSDVHRGQFAGRDCTTCHDQSGWKPAPGFDHAKTSWPLSGRHAGVACARCHREERDDPGDRESVYVRFKGVSGRECSSCHEDVHRARLGTACAGCHSTAGWSQVERARFDHGRTGYPLEGRHADVACDRCHRRGSARPLRHERCTDCHADAHFGQLAHREDGGACESCHTVDGFSPARYGLDEHRKTDYPLLGGHVAVACNACHIPASVAELRGTSGVAITTSASGRSPRFRFASTRCAACHRDPHAGELDRWVSQGGCESCHREESWRAAAETFDHSRTRFALTGAHAEPECAACHKKVDTETQRVRFAGVPLSCEGCHRDAHHGQFRRSGKETSCDRCHDPVSLKASRFDHARDSSWPLEGAHQRTPCAACHRHETRDGVTFVRYTPLPATCRGCHAGSTFTESDLARP